MKNNIAKQVKKIILIYGLIIGTFSGASAQQLITYSEIPGRSPSEHYTCRVKLLSESDDSWRNVFVLQTEAKDNGDEGYFKTLRGWTASWVAFESDFKGKVIVEISKKDGTAITKAMVRPVAHAQPAVIKSGKAYVTFSKSTNVNVDINGQMEDQYTGFGYDGPDVHTISIFANPLFPVPDPKNKNVKVLKPGEDITTLNRADWDTLIFAPGIHTVADTVFEIHSNEVLFIPGDAIVKGNIHPKEKAWGKDASKNFKVYGSGTLSGEDLARHKDDKGKVFKLFTHQAEGAHLEGFVVADPAFHTFNMGHSGGDKSNINRYKNLKILGWRINSDGVNAFRHSEVSDCFFRTQDDSFYLGSDHVNQHDNVVWNDANGSVLFVPRGDGSTCTFRDITVIYHRAGWHWWSGGRIFSMRETNADATIANVHIQNILVEDPFPAFPPFYAKIRKKGKGQVTLKNIVIENVRQIHDGVNTKLDAERGKPQNTLLGLDADHQWSNITFKNCYFNGKWLRSLEDGNFKTEFVDESSIRFEVTEQ